MDLDLKLSVQEWDFIEYSFTRANFRFRMEHAESVTEREQWLIRISTALRLRIQQTDTQWEDL